MFGGVQAAAPHPLARAIESSYIPLMSYADRNVLALLTSALLAGLLLRLAR